MSWCFLVPGRFRVVYNPSCLVYTKSLIRLRKSESRHLLSSERSGTSRLDRSIGGDKNVRERHFSTSLLDIYPSDKVTLTTRLQSPLS